jgi:hypothetical protein
MPHRLVLAGLFLLSIGGCGKPKPDPEQLTFTRQSPDFTRDRADSAGANLRFTDITLGAGIDFVHTTGAFGNKWMPETIGSGGGFFDYDGDGWPDLLLVNSTEWPGHASGAPLPTSKLYRNRGDGTYEDITARAGLDFSFYGMGAAFADYDADGDTDMYLTAVGDNRLLRNDNGRFVDVTAAARVSGNDPAPGATPAWSSSAAWVDVDRDGWLDLFVANYVKWTPETDIYVTRDGKTKSYATPEGYRGESCRLYRNLGGNAFEDVTVEAGVFNDEGKSLGVAVADFNDDGWPDLAVSNDTQPNFLYLNDGDGTFTESGVAAGIAYDEVGRARAGMGIDVADAANDGRLSIAIGNFSKEPLSFYTQIGDGQLFQDRAGATRLTRPSLLALTFGIHFADFDLDGRLDLVAANGHIEPEINAVQQDITFAQKPQLFWNAGATFIDLGDAVGPAFDEPIVARGVASADIDRDGDLDLLLTVNGGAPRLLRNDTMTPGSIRLRFEGRAPNRRALGAQVTVWAGGVAQRRMVRTGSSFLTQSYANELVVGLGSSVQADSLHVRWPTTRNLTRVDAIPAGETRVLRE